MVKNLVDVQTIFYLRIPLFHDFSACLLRVAQKNLDAVLICRKK